MDFANDISLELAVAAHSGVSFVPEKRGAAERADYAQTLAADYDEFLKQAQRGGTLDLLPEEFARYRAAYARHTRAYLASRSRCLSPMITGPARFPTERNRKRGDIAHRRLTELIDFRARARRAIIAKLRPDLQPIRASDADAIQRLQAQLSALEASHVQMKLANAAILKHKGFDARKLALVSLGFSATDAVELLTPKFGNGIGFASYSLKNNSANMRRIRLRIEQISAAQAKPVTTTQGANGVRLEEDPPGNRVRLFFPAIPAYELRKRMKKNGFRFAPSTCAWQAFRNSSSLALAREIAGVAAPAAAPAPMPGTG